MAKARDSAPDHAPQKTDADDAPGLGQFEASVAELEGLVEALEAGDTSLEDALSKFERGVTLSRQCQTLLKNAELRVDQLMTDGNSERVVALDPPADDESNQHA